MLNTLESLPFSNSYSALPDDFYYHVDISPFVTEMYLIHYNSCVSELLAGLLADTYAEQDDYERYTGEPPDGVNDIEVS